MSRYKCLSVCLILCLIFSGFSAPAEAALPESQAAQRTVQDLSLIHISPQRQLLSRKPPSPLVFLLISMHFTATLGIPLSSPVLKIYSFSCSSGVKPRYFTSDLQTRLHALYTQ